MKELDTHELYNKTEIVLKAMETAGFTNYDAYMVCGAILNYLEKQAEEYDNNDFKPSSSLN